LFEKMTTFKTIWNVSKGIPWSKDEIDVHIQNCINYLVEVLQENPTLFALGSDWYLEEFTCCLKRFCSCHGVSWENTCLVDSECSNLQLAPFTFLSEVHDGIFNHEKMCQLIILMAFIMISFDASRGVYGQELLNTITNISNGTLSGDTSLLTKYLCHIMLPHTSQSVDNGLMPSVDSDYDLKLAYLQLLRDVKEKTIPCFELDKICKRLQQFESPSKDSPLLAIYTNLLACGYAKMNKFQTCLVLLRKSISLDFESKNLVPYLLNSHFALDLAGDFKPSWRVLELVDNYISQKHDDDSPKLSFVLDSSERKISCLQISRKVSMPYKILIKSYVAQYALKTKRLDTAVSLYEEIINYMKSECFSTNGSDSLPFHFPTSLQIYAELSYASFICRKLDRSCMFSCIDLTSSSSEYNKGLSAINDNESEYIRASIALYYCVCCKLFLASTHLSKGDLIEAKSTLMSCLLALDTVSSSSLSKTSRFKTQSILQSCLLSLKAKVLFNYALVLALQDNNSENVIQFLHCAVQFDSRNLQLRWNVVKLLCHTNRKVEALQFWCDTRSWDFHMDAEKLEDLQLIKSSELIGCNTDDASANFVKQDLAVINELIQIQLK